MLSGKDIFFAKNLAHLKLGDGAMVFASLSTGDFPPCHAPGENRMFLFEGKPRVLCWQGPAEWPGGMFYGRFLIFLLVAFRSGLSHTLCPPCPGLGQTNPFKQDVQGELVSEPGSVHLSGDTGSAHELEEGRKIPVFIAISPRPSLTLG